MDRRRVRDARIARLDRRARVRRHRARRRPRRIRTLAGERLAAWTDDAPATPPPQAGSRDRAST